MLINGKGSVNCQPQELLNKLTPPPLLKLLNGSFVSDRGCTPATKEALDQGQNFTIDYSKLPAGLQDGCKPTVGSEEIILVDAQNGWASIHWINAMSVKTPVVSIDEHPMIVYAVDGAYIHPQPADTIFAYNGERYSAMIKLDKPAGDYTIRVANKAADQIMAALPNSVTLTQPTDTTPPPPRTAPPNQSPSSTMRVAMYRPL